jgi:hypothetical protein
MIDGARDGQSGFFHGPSRLGDTNAVARRGGFFSIDAKPLDEAILKLHIIRKSSMMTWKMFCSQSDGQRDVF